MTTTSDNDTDGTTGRADSGAHLNRRTMLKAASAAGIVWATPALYSVPAHAAGYCVILQFDGNQVPVTTTDSADDAVIGCSDLDPCDPSASSSRCTCAFEPGVDPPLFPYGTWSGNTYTLNDPTTTTCTILWGTVRWWVQTASGCDFQYPCKTVSLPPDLPADGLSITFPDPGSEIVLAYRIVICC